MSEHGQLRLTLLAAVALGCIMGAYWSARLAYAELLYSRGTPESVERAASLASGNAQYGERKAELAEAAGPNPKAEDALRAVLRARPGDSEALIALGLRAELRNDFSAAERDLLEAARHDRGYDPRWTLANYYYRRQDNRNSWKWARAACEMAHEPTPLFRLLWNYTGDAAEIFDRAVPNQPVILRQYLDFLLGGTHWEAADAPARRILKRPAAEDAPVLLAYCDRLLDARKGPPALEIWNTLAHRGLIAFPPLDPERGPVNGRFEIPSSGAGFDWRIPQIDGIEAAQDEPGLRLSFNGEQPETCEPLWQYVVLQAGLRYQMTFEYVASDIPERSGLRWRLLDVTGEPTLIAESGNLAEEGWSKGKVQFQAPSGMSLGRVALSYRRPRGTTRIEGSIRLRSVTLGRAD